MPGAARKPPPTRGARKFVQQQLDRAAVQAPDLPVATVTATSPLTVSFRGASLTMRRLAQRLGVEAMSLYHHVAGKRDLLGGIAELVVRQIELPAPEGDEIRSTCEPRGFGSVRVRAENLEQGDQVTVIVDIT